jgi:hypothetical protein
MLALEDPAIFVVVVVGRDDATASPCGSLPCFLLDFRGSKFLSFESGGIASAIIMDGDANDSNRAVNDGDFEVNLCDCHIDGSAAEDAAGRRSDRPILCGLWQVEKYVYVLGEPVIQYRRGNQS